MEMVSEDVASTYLYRCQRVRKMGVTNMYHLVVDEELFLRHDCGLVEYVL
jgi:hypothetical protein